MEVIIYIKLPITMIQMNTLSLLLKEMIFHIMSLNIIINIFNRIRNILILNDAKNY